MIALQIWPGPVTPLLVALVISLGAPLPSWTLGGTLSSLELEAEWFVFCIMGSATIGDVDL